jgi:hypothetical protein
MSQEDDERKHQTGTQKETILGIQIKYNVVHRLEAGGLGEDLGDDADKQEVYKERKPYIIPVHLY